MPRTRLTHVDHAGRPTMVDVSGKAVSVRTAIARCDVEFPAAAARVLRADGLRTAKGPVLDTAIVAGALAVKRTHELIPFCHPLAIERCRIDGACVDPSRLRRRRRWLWIATGLIALLLLFPYYIGWFL